MACRLHTAPAVRRVRVSRFGVACVVLLSLFSVVGDAGADPGTQPAAVEVGSADGVELRAFLRDLVAASGVPEAEQPPALREVF